MTNMNKIQESTNSQMTLDINNHANVVTNLTKSTIRPCEKYCNEIDTKVIEKSEEHAKDYVKLLNKEWAIQEKERAVEAFKFWEGLKSEITKLQSKLIERIA